MPPGKETLVELSYIRSATKSRAPNMHKAKFADKATNLVKKASIEKKNIKHLKIDN